MATLPNPDEIQRVQPRPSGAVVGIDARLAGESTRVLGNTVSELANREIARLDDLKVSDAETQLMRKELEMTEAYKQVKGGDVLSPDFHKGFQERYTTSTDEILNSLSTPAQKARFQELAKRRAVAFDAQRISHAMGEADRFETAQHEARLQVLVDKGIAQYADPAAVATTAMELNNEVVKWGVKKGMSDPAMATAYTKKVNGAFYSALIEQALVNNDNSTANTLFAASRQFMTPDQAKAIQSQLKVGNDFTEGQKLALDAQKMISEGKTLQEVEVFVASSASTPGAYTAAQTIFTNLQQANDKAQKEAVGVVTEKFHNLNGTANAKMQVLNSAEYKRLTPSQRTTVLDYMESHIDADRAQYRAEVSFNQGQADRRERKAEEKAKKYRTDQAMATFNRYVTSPTLKDMSVQQLYGLAPELGLDAVSKLLTVQKALTEGAKPIQLDKALVDAAMPADLKKDAKTAKRDAYLGFVQEATIEWQANNPGKRPTIEEQKAIARSANAEFNLPGRMFGTNTYSIMDSNIPNTTEAQAKRDIIKAATAKGKTLTPEQVDAIYLRSITPTK